MFQLCSYSGLHTRDFSSQSCLPAVAHQRKQSELHTSRHTVHRVLLITRDPSAAQPCQVSEQRRWNYGILEGLSSNQNAWSGLTLVSLNPSSVLFWFSSPPRHFLSQPPPRLPPHLFIFLTLPLFSPLF